MRTQWSRNENEGKYAGKRNGKHMRSSYQRWKHQHIYALSRKTCAYCKGGGQICIGTHPGNYFDPPEAILEPCPDCCGYGWI